MIYAFDTFYYPDCAKTVCIAFEQWDSETEHFIYSENTEINSDYESGAFYKRELPCILSLLKKIDLKDGDLIIVDGYVALGNNGKIGLGGYLYESLNKKYPVIGIAKNGFASEDNMRKTIFRGKSKIPLFLTAKGIDADKTKINIENMHGAYRIPTLLKKLDKLTKEKDELNTIS